MPNPQTPRTTTVKKIIVMISSRCADTVTFDGKKQKLSDLRKKLKDELEEATLLDPNQKVFQVWMNEDEGAEGGASSIWDNCMKQVRAADIILVLYNGQSGWAEQGGVGICHAELEAALSTAPDKVRMIRLQPQKIGTGEEGKRNRRFRKYVERQDLIVEIPEDGDDIIPKCKKALYKAVLEMTRHGARGAHRGRYYTGDPLEWSNLDFQRRQKKMVEVLCDELRNRPNTVVIDGNIYARFAGKSVLLLCHAVPAAMSVSAAREMTGQPFLRDYTYAEMLEGRHVGPVHLIACNRSITEAQAIKQLGFPDATIVSPPFGVYVADNIQKIQLAFIANCRDDTTTREGVERFFNWLEKSDEDVELARRAAARKRIVTAIAHEVMAGSGK
ncbi:MAG TPA: DUF4062 domain-containing protein [Pyrinomonadaceae bacterium]|jgi:hypothetical protein